MYKPRYMYTNNMLVVFLLSYFCLIFVNFVTYTFSQIQSQLNLSLFILFYNPSYNQMQVYIKLQAIKSVGRRDRV